MTTEKHDPDPEFVVQLERELVTEFRRLERLGGAGPRRFDAGKWLRAAVWAAAGVLLGAASLTMAQRLEGNEQLESLQRRAEAVARIAAQRVDVSRRMLESAQRDHEVGIASDAMIAPAMAAYVDAERELRLAQLDVAEIAAAGRAPRKEISAPLVRGRDFVTERLQTELDAASRLAELREPVITMAETGVRAGLNTPSGLSSLTLERQRLAAKADRVRALLELRRAFLDGELAAEEAELRHDLLLASARRDGATTELEVLRPENASLRRRQEAGLISETEVYASTQRLLAAEAEVELAQIEIDRLEQALDRRRSD